MNTGLPKEIADTVQLMHDIHTQIYDLKLSNKQSSCKHGNMVFKHPNWEESCRYCQLDACGLKICTLCNKEL
jgi:hypothetical protein